MKINQKPRFETISASQGNIIGIERIPRYFGSVASIFKFEDRALEEKLRIARGERLR